MLDDLGLIHMNGRIYDPLLGRMLSADVFVQNPGSLQEYNRYSYVRNNPLSFTDPTGWFAFPILPMWIDPNTAKETPKAAANFTVGVVGGLVEANSTAKIDTTGNLPATAGKVVGNALGVAEGTGGVMLGGGVAGGGGALAPVTGGLGAAAVPVGLGVAGAGATVAVNASHKLGDSIQQLRSEVQGVQPRDGSKIDPKQAATKPIDSTRPQHGTREHDATSFNEAKSMGEQAGNSDPRFNQTLTNTEGEKVSNLGPDAQVTRTLEDGTKVKDVIEVRSPSQSPSFMDKKVETIKSVLGDQAGDVKWIEPKDKLRNP